MFNQGSQSVIQKWSTPVTRTAVVILTIFVWSKEIKSLLLHNYDISSIFSIKALLKIGVKTILSQFFCPSIRLSRQTGQLVIYQSVRLSFLQIYSCAVNSCLLLFQERLQFQIKQKHSWLKLSFTHSLYTYCAFWVLWRFFDTVNSV